MGRDNLSYVVVGVIIWISCWNLSDLLFGKLSRSTQIKINMTIFVTGILIFLLLDRCHGNKLFGKSS
uniref:Uncharacterized protein n=1 Tax=viral metagenome TaxID=1070528 RepID=A0A6C0CGS7_9ZZZZ